MSLNKLPRCFLIALLIFAAAATALAQSGVEYGGATSRAGVAARAVKSPSSKATVPASESGAPNLHMPAASGQSDAATNRLALEKRAGPDAAKILLGSVPDHAQVWIDAQFVGATPLELKLAPGHHQVLMRASNMEDGQQAVELPAKQSQQVVLSLKPRYPQKFGLRWSKPN